MTLNTMWADVQWNAPVCEGAYCDPGDAVEYEPGELRDSDRFRYYQALSRVTLGQMTKRDRKRLAKKFPGVTMLVEGLSL